MNDVLATMLGALVGAPALPGARCRGRSHLFDDIAEGELRDVMDARHQQALGLCRTCPALASCSAWFDSLPKSRRPLGVVAGKVNAPSRPGRPAAAS